MTSKPVLRAATAEDDEAIAACIGEAFPGNPKADVEVLRWQYRRNPFGPTPSWVWDDDGRVVGHYSAYPMPYLLDGRAALGANAVDAAVAPSHQGRGLFTPMALALYEDCAAQGMPVAVCYASNPVAMRGVAKAGVRWMPRLRTMVLAVDDAWLGRRFHVPAAIAGVARRAAFGLGRGPAGEEVDAPPAGLDDLWGTTVTAGGIRNGVARGAAWWKWRYAESPIGRYRFVAVRRAGRLSGAAVVAERDDFGGRFGYVLELLADEPESARSLLRAIVGERRGLSGLATVAVDRGPLHRLATSAGMRTLPRRLEPKGGAWYGLVGATGGPWHVGWGDMDHL